MKTCGRVVCVDASGVGSALFDYPKGFVRKGRSYCVSGWSESDGLTLVGLPAILKSTGKDVGFHPIRFRPVEEACGEVSEENCASEAEKGKAQRVLLVDDDQDLLDMWREILMGGLPGQPEIQTAASGARALRVLMAEPFDLLVCELRMPRVNGLELLAAVGPMYPRVRTALLTCETGKQFERFRLQARALGVDAFWSMPASEEESRMFVANVQSLLELGIKPPAGVLGRARAWWWRVRGTAKKRVDLLLAPVWRVGRMLRGSRRALTRGKQRLWVLAGEALAVARPNAPVEEWCRRGEACYYGEGVQKNPAEAVKWFRWAALRGFARAQCWLGYCYQRYLYGVTGDVAQSVRWLQKAARQGEMTAEYNLGICFEGGLGVSKDKERMIMWYRRAAEQGHLGAHFRLGMHYTTLARTGRLGADAETREGLKWLERAAERGHTMSQLQLGHLHYLPGGDIAEAVKWYRRGVEGGSAEAVAALGRCFEEGRGVPQDYAEAMRSYKEAAENRGKYGPYYIGCCYAEGRGVAPDTIEASKWFRRAAEQGCEEAMLEIGRRYARGEGVPQNLREAERWSGAPAERRSEEERYWCFNVEEPARPKKPDAEPAAKLAGKPFCQARSPRSLRIVMLDDEPLVLDALKMMLEFDHPSSFVLTFTNAESALQELEWEEPDLFTTDWNHPGKLCGDSLLRVLAGRGVKYPIFVITAYAECIAEKDGLKGLLDQGLNVTLLSKPFLMEDLRRLIAEHVDLSGEDLPTGEQGRDPKGKA
jgi:TPR repeat protein/response regulator RpfG family c-di-GMP phosphodiesterase